MLRRRYYHGPISDHFDGERFFSPFYSGRPQPGDLWKWQHERSRPIWPRSMPNLCYDHPPEKVDGTALRVSYVGHTTFLIQTHGLNILTDPIWSKRASPLPWIGPKRVHSPGIHWADLPPIDLVLISHNHYDHLDLPTIKRLWYRDRPCIFTPLGNDRIIRRRNTAITVEAMDWHDVCSTTVPEVEIVLLPAQHWSARGLKDRNLALWGAFGIRTPSGSIYFAGDTGFGEGHHFTIAHNTLTPIRLALLPIGDYAPRWFMRHSHMDPEEAIHATHLLASKHNISMHHDVFPLSDVAYGEAITSLRDALDTMEGARPHFDIMDVGSHQWIPTL
jgi:L-ascorbate metabolism protein UlaG (beta-lactamase superfamily)